MRSILTLLCTYVLFFANYGQNQSLETNMPIRARSASNYGTARASSATVRLDSVLQEGNFKHEYQYDARGNEILKTTSAWDATSGTWLKKSKVEQAVNALGDTTLYSNYQWSSVKNAWVGNAKYEITYNILGLPTLYMRYFWDPVSSAWSPDVKIEKAYGTTSRMIISELAYSWNTATATWRLTKKLAYVYNNKRLATYFISVWGINDMLTYSKTEYVYDAVGNITSEAEYIWSTDRWKEHTKVESIYNTENKLVQKKSFSKVAEVWEQVDKTEYTYDQVLNLTKETKFKWDESVQTWQGFSKTEMTYDDTTLVSSVTSNWVFNDWLYYSKAEYTFNEEGRQTLMAVYGWNIATLKWVELLRNENSYTAVGDTTSSTRYTLHQNPMAWLGTSKYEQAFDRHGNKTLKVLYAWDQNAQAWVGSHKYEVVCDTTVLRSTLTLPEGDWGHHKTISQLHYKWANNTWIAEKPYEYYYSNHIVDGVDDAALSNTNMRYYPNPTADGLLHRQTEIPVLKVEVRNLHNQLVQQSGPSDTLDLSKLPEGTYLLHTTTEYGTQVHKIVKQ